MTDRKIDTQTNVSTPTSTQFHRGEVGVPGNGATVSGLHPLRLKDHGYRRPLMRKAKEKSVVAQPPTSRI